MSRVRKQGKQFRAKGVRTAATDEPAVEQTQRYGSGDEETGGAEYIGTFMHCSCVPGGDGGHGHQILLKDLFVGPPVDGEMVLVRCDAGSGENPESWAAGDVVSFRLEGGGGSGQRIVPGSLRRWTQCLEETDSQEALQKYGHSSGETYLGRIWRLLTSLFSAGDAGRRPAS